MNKQDSEGAYSTNKNPNQIIRRIVVNGHPKSGNTWLVGLIATALEGQPLQTGDEPDVVDPSRLVVDKSHHPLPPRPGEKDLYVLRDFRDVVISSLFRHSAVYQWPRRVLTASESELVLLEFLARLTGDRGLVRPYKYPVWDEHARQGLAWAHARTRYETLVADPVRVLETLLIEIGCRVSEERLKHAVRHHQPEQLKTRWTDRFWSGFVRKGSVGEWKAYFTRRAGEYCHALMGKALAQHGYIESERWYEDLPTVPPTVLDFSKPPIVQRSAKPKRIPARTDSSIQ